MCRIEKYTKRQLVVCRSAAINRGALIAELARLVETDTGLKAAVVEEAVRERERYGTTGIGNGVAIPHCRIKGIRDIVLVIATTARPLDYDAPDGTGAELIFLIVVPEGNNLTYLKLLSRISVLASDRAIRQRLMAAQNADDIMNILKEAA